MALSLVGVGEETFGTTSATCAKPVGYTDTDGDLALLLVVSKRVTNTPNTPAGWALRDNEIGGITDSGADVGEVRAMLFSRTVSGGSLTIPAVTQTSHTGAVLGVVCAILRSDTGGYSIASGGIDDGDASNTSFGGTLGSDIGFETDDQVLILSGLTSDTPAFDTASISATGATFSALAEEEDAGSASGHDIGIGVHSGSVTAGTSSAAATTSFTLTTSVSSGVQLVIRIREAPTPPSVRESHADEGAGVAASVTLSANVEATDLIVVFEASESATSDLTFPTPPSSTGKTFSPIRVGANPAAAAPMSALYLSTGFTGSETITSGASDADSLFLTVYVVKDATCVMACSETNGDNVGTTHTAPSLSALDNDLAIGHWVCNLATAGADYSSVGTGLTEAEAILVTNDCAMISGYKSITADGATGTLDATFSASGSDYQGMSVIVRNSTATRRNLCPNPALANDATGWVSDDDGTWARVTAHANFERANAYGASDLVGGSDVVDIRSARGDSTASQFYTMAASLYANGDDVVTGWNYASWTSGEALSFHGSWNHDHPDGVVTRWSMGFMTPADSAEIAINAFLGTLPAGVTEMQISDVRIELGGWPDTIVYKDGDSSGWAWDGTAGSSTSAESDASEVTGTAAAPLGGLTSTAAGVKTVGGAAPAALGAIVSVAVGVITSPLSAIRRMFARSRAANF